MRASDFIATLGVNTHIGSDPYNDPAQIEDLLTYLGIQNIRQSSPIDAQSASEIQQIGQLGAKIDLIINGGGPVNLAGAMQNVYQLAPYLNAVENVDEVNNYPITYDGLTGVAAAVALQEDLYDAVRSDPTLDGVPVYLFTLGGADPSAFPAIGNLSAYADFGNIHSYPPQGLPPIFVIHAAIAGGDTDTPTKPVVLTETGYYTLTSGAGWGGVPQSVQASYILDEVLDEAAAGVARTYLYDLMDDGSDSAMDNQEDHFGLFNEDGTPKESATDLHNLTTILADPGATAASFTPTPLAYTVAGLPFNYTGNTLDLDQSDGAHLIAIWNEEELWDTTTLSALPATTYPVTVNFAATQNTVLVYDPTIGTEPIETLTDVNQVSLNIVDHPLIIDVLPDGTTTPISTTIIGSGPDTLALSISEDAWQGNAQFTVAVDGQQIGGVQTATALHVDGQTQVLDVLGSFGTVAQTATLAFLNDAYGGTPETDRNLYAVANSVDGVPVGNVFVNGVVQPIDLAMYRAGPSSFAFEDAPVTPTDTLVLAVSEDAWDGNAAFVVTMDGVQLGGTQTVTALHDLDSSNFFTLSGDWGDDAHQVGISFINDAYGGSPEADRNLYVDTATYDGAVIIGTTASLYTDQTDTLSVPGSSTGLVIELAEDAYDGNAQFTVAVDGTQVGAAQQVTALHSSGDAEAFNVDASLTAGTHDVAVSFVNDLYGGSPTADRNLYVDGASQNGTQLGWSASMYTDSTTTFTLIVPS